MKALLALTATIFLTIANHSAEAYKQVTQYEITNPASGSMVPYPNLDLNNLEKVKIQTSSSIENPTPHINRLELIFENATNLTVKNFQKVGDPYTPQPAIYKAVVNDAWIYSKLLVQVESQEPISGNANISIRLEVVELESNLNDPEHIAGYTIFDADGYLVDVTPNPVVDIERVDYQGDRLILKLLKHAKFDEFTGEGLKLKSTWMGHGERTINVPAPFPSDQFSWFKAAGIEIQSETFPDGYVEYNFRIKYEDEFGYAEYTPYESLNQYIDDAYQSSNP